MGRILRHTYKGFTAEEQEEIVNRSLQILNFDLQTGEEDEIRKDRERTWFTPGCSNA